MSCAGPYLWVKGRARPALPLPTNGDGHFHWRKGVPQSIAFAPFRTSLLYAHSNRTYVHSLGNIQQLQALLAL